MARIHIQRLLFLIPIRSTVLTLVKLFNTFLGLGSNNKVEIWPVEGQNSRIRVFTEGDEGTKKCDITLHEKPISAALITGHTAELETIVCDADFGKKVENKVDEIIVKLRLNDVHVVDATDSTHSVVIVMSKGSTNPPCQTRVVTGVLPKKFFNEHAYLLESIPCLGELDFENQVKTVVGNIEQKLAELPPHKSVQDAYLAIQNAFSQPVKPGTLNGDKCHAGFAYERLTFTLIVPRATECTWPWVQDVRQKFLGTMRLSSASAESPRVSVGKLEKTPSSSWIVSINCYFDGNVFAVISHENSGLLSSRDLFDQLIENQDALRKFTTAACNILARNNPETRELLGLGGR